MLLESRDNAAARAVREVQRLRHDRIRWARTCYRIRTRRGEIVPLVFNAVQAAILREEEAMLREAGRARLFVLKARRAGVSTAEQAKCFHQIWSERNFDAMTLAHTLGDMDKLFEITTRALNHFPRPLLPKSGPKETTEISFPARDATFYTGTAGAKRTGRGLTLKRVHGSEFAFWDSPTDILSSFAPALEGVPGSVIVLETTASGYDSIPHRFWREAKKGENGYRALFYPWWECDPVNYRMPLLALDELGTLSNEEQDLAGRHGLDLEQLKWRRAKIKEHGRAEFLKEYAEDDESCWLVGGTLFFEAESLKSLLARAPTPARTELGGSLEIYSEIQAGERAVVGCDTAEGGGGPDDHRDRSTWVARAFPSGRLLSRYADNRVEPKEFAELLNKYGRLYNDALLVIEKNAHGITVLRELRDAHSYPRARIYHRHVQDRNQKEQTEKIGWATTKESLPLMLDAFREVMEAAEEGLITPPCKSVMSDAFGVQRDKSGKVSLNGKDVLVAEVLAWIGRTAMPAGPLSYARASRKPA